MAAEKRSSLFLQQLSNPTALTKGVTLFAAWVLVCLSLGGCGDPKVSGVHLNAGLAYMETKQYPLAMQELMKAEKLNPSDPSVHYYMGVIYHARGMTKEAMGEMERAIALKADYADAYNYLGLIYDNGGQYEKAVACFKKAATNVLYETPSYAWNNLGGTYYKMGNYDASAAAYAEAARLDINVVNRATFEINAGRALMTKGDADKAIPYFRDVQKIMPDAFEAHYWLGKAYQLKNNREEALKAFRTVVEKAPNTPLQAKAQEAIDQINRETPKTVEPKIIEPKKPATSAVDTATPAPVEIIKKEKETTDDQSAVAKKKHKKKKKKIKTTTIQSLIDED